MTDRAYNLQYLQQNDFLKSQWFIKKSFNFVHVDPSCRELQTKIIDIHFPQDLHGVVDPFPSMPRGITMRLKRFGCNIPDPLILKHLKLFNKVL